MTAAAHATGIAQSHRCERCGVQSSEPTCFVIPERHSKRRKDVRCVMCEQARVTRPARGIWGILSTTLGPVFILLVLQQGDVTLSVPILLGAFLLYPAAIIAHELGHALVGRLLGLEIGQ
jgi:hypothetical protein